MWESEHALRLQHALRRGWMTGRLQTAFSTPDNISQVERQAFGHSDIDLAAGCTWITHDHVLCWNMAGHAWPGPWLILRRRLVIYFGILECLSKKTPEHCVDSEAKLRTLRRSMCLCRQGTVANLPHLHRARAWIRGSTAALRKPVAVQPMAVAGSRTIVTCARVHSNRSSLVQIFPGPANPYRVHLRHTALLLLLGLASNPNTFCTAGGKHLICRKARQDRRLVACSSLPSATTAQLPTTCAWAAVSVPLCAQSRIGVRGCSRQHIIACPATCCSTRVQGPQHRSAWAQEALGDNYELQQVASARAALGDLACASGGRRHQCAR